MPEMEMFKIGANKTYVNSGTGVKTGNTVSLSDGITGTEYTETVTLTLSPNLVIRQRIAITSPNSGFAGVDGVLGLGPADLTQGTLSPASATIVPTVVDNLFTQGLIPVDAVGIYFQPTTSQSSVNGELDFGGIDTSVRFSRSLCAAKGRVEEALL